MTKKRAIFSSFRTCAQSQLLYIAIRICSNQTRCWRSFVAISEVLCSIKCCTIESTIPIYKWYLLKICLTEQNSWYIIIVWLKIVSYCPLCVGKVMWLFKNPQNNALYHNIFIKQLKETIFDSQFIFSMNNTKWRHPFTTLVPRY